MRFIILTILLILALLEPGCLHVKVDPVEVKPITLNVNLKIDRQLDDFFAFENTAGTTTAPATAPAVSVPTTIPAVQQ